MHSKEYVNSSRPDVMRIMKTLKVEPRNPPPQIGLLKERLKTLLLGVPDTDSDSMTRTLAREAWKNAKFALQNQVTLVNRVHCDTYQHTRIYWRVDCNVLL